MRKTRTTFYKVNVLVILLLIPVIILYSLSNYISVKVVEEEIRTRNLNRLSIIQSQIDANIDNLTSYLYTLSADPDVLNFRNIQYYSSYRQIEIKKRLMEKLMLYKEQSNWASNIRLYNTQTKQAIGSDSAVFNEYELQTLFYPNWGIKSQSIDGREEPQFTKHLYQPFDTTYNYHLATLIYEVGFPVRALQPLLEQLKTDTEADPFLYIPGYKPLMTEAASESLIMTLLRTSDLESFGKRGSLTVKLDNQDYLISYVRSETMNWILIDYVPLKVILSPINKSNLMFYGSVSLLLFLSLMASLLLYRNVHRPIRKMMKSMQLFQQGQYHVRLALKQNGEFNIMYQRFNDMAGQIQHLIEEVLAGKIMAHEARLKLLQSQINPHFLYNCLNFIKNMAKMGDEEAVEAMALHLGKYYRYLQRSEEEWTTVRDEMQLIASFLEIHALRLQDLSYEIERDPNMEELRIPRLLIQPVVENAIVHGFRQQAGSCIVRIKTAQDERFHSITVEDSGVGMRTEELHALRERLKQPMSKEMGCGVWNVRQRLIYQFGAESGMNFSVSPLGGLRVHLYWKRK